jgi:DNA-binding HxlR family transcriptional regulator
MTETSATSQPMDKELNTSSNCNRVSSVLARVGDKWSVQIIMRLGSGTLRFNEIRRSIGGISQRMLTLTLRGLERDGLVTRTVFATVPPRVDYALTELGVSLASPVMALGAWALDHLDDIEAAQHRFEAVGTAPAVQRHSL